MNLDEDNPCPHCGNIETLTDRTDDDFKPVIPEDLQFDFKKEAGDESNIFIAPTPQEIYGNNDTSTNENLPEPPQPVQSKTQPEDLPEPPQPVPTDTQPESSPTPISQNIPLESLFPPIEGVTLDPASLKVYFQLSIEFQIILNKATNYRQGVYRWNLLLPDRLQEYGLTEEAWQRISAQGDADEKIQEQLSIILKSIFG
ncbi:MAG: hypothetical protein JSW11_04785 [Candidatus Heimdallarchaeota archaeon]|nr:MAG: hypothetical protein JSW11_04785 [Candidatus Heimdallarchaeota archaeon]